MRDHNGISQFLSGQVIQVPPTSNKDLVLCKCLEISQNLLKKGNSNGLKFNLSLSFRALKLKLNCKVILFTHFVD